MSANLVFGVNALLHVFILSSFLVIFYAVYISKVEKSAINGQLRRMLNKSLPDLFASADASSGNAFTTLTQTLKATGVTGRLKKAYATEDNATRLYNEGLMRSAFITIGALFVLTIVVIMLLTQICGIDVHLTSLLRENAALFIAIGIAEYVFFTRVALKFVPAVPSFISDQLTASLQAEFK